MLLPILFVQATAGQASPVRRPALDQIGLLYERFFMYGEDVDWCWCVVKEIEAGKTEKPQPCFRFSLGYKLGLLCLDSDFSIGWPTTL